MTGPAPVMEPVVFVGPAGGCPEEFERCLDKKNATALLVNIVSLQRYATEAETLCYARPDAGALDAGSP